MEEDWSTAAPEKGLVNRRPIPSSSPAVITQMRNNPPPHALLRSAFSSVIFISRCHIC